MSSYERERDAPPMAVEAYQKDELMLIPALKAAESALYEAKGDRLLAQVIFCGNSSVSLT